MNYTSSIPSLSSVGCESSLPIICTSAREFGSSKLNAVVGLADRGGRDKEQFSFPYATTVLYPIWDAPRRVSMELSPDRRPGVLEH